MQKYSSNIADARGNAVGVVSIAVTDKATGSLASLFSDNDVTKTLANPFLTDALSNFAFYAANGRYSWSVSGASFAGSVTDILLYDPNDDTSLQLADYTALRAYAGARQSVYVTGYLGSAAPSGIAGMFVRDDSDTTTADNGGTVIVAGNGKRWKRANAGALTPEMFGAARDGITNDTAALNKWATALQSGKVSGKATPGIYRVSQASLGVVFSGLVGVSVDFSGATFKVLNGDTVAGGQAGFLFQNCVDCNFYGFVYDGNRAARTPAEVYSHNIVIGGGMARCRFWSCRSINAVCDPWYVAPSITSDLSNYPTDIHLHDCEGYNGYRNNLSLIGSVRFRMYGGSLNAANGTAPQCGFDVEPDSGTTYGNDQFEFHNVETNDNIGYGRQYGGPIENTNGKDVGARGRNNTQGFFNVSRAKGLEIINPRCGPHSSATRGLIDIAISAIDVKVSNPSFRDITATGSAVCMYVHAGATGTTIQNLTAKTVSCPVLAIHGQISLRGVNIDGCTAGPTINTDAANAELIDISVRNSTERALYINGANTTLVNVNIEDCAITGGFGAIDIDTSATGSVVRGAKIRQSSGTVPSGQIGIRAQCAMNELSGIEAYGGYTASNVLTITAANAASTKMYGINPDPLAASIATAGGSLGTGHTLIGVVAVPIAAIGTPISVALDTNPQGVLFHAQVYQSFGSNVAVYGENTTGAPVTIAAGNYKVRAHKP